MAILDPAIECADPSLIRQVQLERLQATLNRAYRNVRYYREVLDRAQRLPEQIQSLHDLPQIPLTSREDLLAHQPYGLFAVPLRDVVRLHPSAGAGGPVVVGYTRNDIATWTHMAARALASAGVTREDVVQISLDYAESAAALGAQSGAEALEASIIPCSGLSPERQADVLRQFRATVLIATPPQALELGYAMRNVAPVETTLRIAFIVGEVWSDTLRHEIEQALHVQAFGSYGLSEMAVPGLATECEHHSGLHLSEDHVLAEVIDPGTGQPMPVGATGELVLTTLSREGVPLLRYRTGDLTALEGGLCACGRTLVRMRPTNARADDVVIIGASRLAPSQLDAIVRAFAPGAPWRVVLTREAGKDLLTLELGINIEQFDEEVRRLQTLRESIQTELYRCLSLRARVRLVEPARLRDQPRIDDQRTATLA